MIDCNIELGDGDVSVGITKLNPYDKKIRYGLLFRDLIHSEEIGTNTKGKKTKNRVVITVKNKESLEVLKAAVSNLEKIMNGEDIEKMQKSIDSLNITKEIEKELNKNIAENKDEM